jgi:hypothetical protein
MVAGERCAWKNQKSDELKRTFQSLFNLLPNLNTDKSTFVFGRDWDNEDLYSFGKKSRKNDRLNVYVKQEMQDAAGYVNIVAEKTISLNNRWRWVRYYVGVFAELYLMLYVWARLNSGLFDETRILK